MLTNNVLFNLPRQIKLHAIWLIRNTLSFFNSWVSNSEEEPVGSCTLIAALMLWQGACASTGMHPRRGVLPSAMRERPGEGLPSPGASLHRGPQSAQQKHGHFAFHFVNKIP